jgi:hypothetical protein
VLLVVLGALPFLLYLFLHILCPFFFFQLPSLSSFNMAEEQQPTGENMTMLQGFEWYVPADQKHWVRLEKNVAELKKWGVDNIWIPPA